MRVVLLSLLLLFTTSASPWFNPWTSLQDLISGTPAERIIKTKQAKITDTGTGREAWFKPWTSLQNLISGIPTKREIADSIVETAVASDFLNLVVAEVMKRQTKVMLSEFIIFLIIIIIIITKVPIPDFVVTRLVTENAIRVGLRGAIWYYVDLDETKKQFVPEDVVMGGIMRNALEKSGLPKMYITDTLIMDLIEALEKEGYGKEGILRKFDNLPQS